MSDSVEASIALCNRIARQSGTNFYYSFLVLPKRKREAICAIYAFMRRSDDIADDAPSTDVAIKGLRQWRESVDAALRGNGAADPILPALAATVRTFKIPPELFHELLDGTEMDQSITRYETFEDLYRYCYRVASVVGLIVLPIFGYDDQKALEPAEACGIAFQLTNILRDVKEDAARGRIYLPLEDLRRFGVTEEDLFQNRMTEKFRTLMEFEAARVNEYYRKAEPLRGMIHRDSRSTLGVMVDVYHGLMREIERRQFAVFDKRIRLTKMEKLWIVGKNLLRRG
jgi:phytoene synthase